MRTPPTWVLLVAVAVAGFVAYWAGRRRGGGGYARAFEQVADSAPAVQPYAPMGGNAGMAPYGSLSGSNAATRRAIVTSTAGAR